MATRCIKVIDLFAGAGGFGLGFEMIPEYKIVCSLEVDRWASDTLRANNHDNHIIIEEDIRIFDSSEKIIAACPERPDIIIGGPPCQGFSNAGLKDPKDPRNSLFKNYAQWVDVFKPKIFVMENVKGLLNGKNGDGESVVDIIKETFQKIGYKVDIWDINAANYGVPQSRNRVFIVGNRINIDLSKPPISHYLPEERKKLNGKARTLQQAITVIKAIGDLPKLKAGQGVEESIMKSKPRNEFQKQIRAEGNPLYNHVTMTHTKRLVQRYQQILQGLSLSEIPAELQVRKRNGNGELSKIEFNSNYRHLRPDKVSFTIPASFYSNFVHPNQPRNITSREAARLQSFPDSYIFKGKRTQMSSSLLKKLGREHANFLSQYNQIGNAVPPLLAKAIAKHLLQYF